MQKQDFSECFVLSLIVLVWVLYPLKHLISYDSFDAKRKDLVSSLGCDLEYEHHQTAVGHNTKALDAGTKCCDFDVQFVRSSERRQGEGNVCSDDWQILFTGGFEML